MGLLQRVAVLEKDTELEILGIKFRNGFNVEVPYDVLHTHPVRFSIHADEGISTSRPRVPDPPVINRNHLKISGDQMQMISILKDGSNNQT